MEANRIVKIVTFNINGNLSGIAEEVLLLHPDLIAMQEVPRRTAELMLDGLEKLSSIRWYMFYSEADYLGNAIFSKYTFSSCNRIRLVVSFEARSAAVVDISLSEIFPQLLSSHCLLSFTSIHLDHVDETTRQAQFESYLTQSNVLDVNSNKFVILAGDLNSLCINDYTSNRWRSIKKIRSSSRWEEPQTSLMNGVFENLKFLDSLRQSKFNRTLNDLGEVIAIDDDVVEGTCRFQTRIDYILYKHQQDSDSCYRLEPVPSSYETIASKVSDHSIVSMIFMLVIN